MAPTDIPVALPAPPAPAPPTEATSIDLAAAITEGVSRIVSVNMKELTSHFNTRLSMFSTSVNNSINSLKGTISQTAATPPWDPSPPIPALPVAPTDPAVPVTVFFPPPFSYAPLSAQDLNPFVPSSTINPAADVSSILRYFPEVEASVLQSVVKHELWPQQLHKLITTPNMKPLMFLSLIYTVNGF